MKINKYEVDFKQSFVYVLRSTTKASDFEDKELVEFFEGSYDNDSNEYYLMFISMINSVFTHMAKTFVMSRGTFFENCQKDVNIKDKVKIHSGNYSTFLCFCFQHGYIKRLREPTGRKGGVYQIIDPDIVKKMNELQGQMFFQEQESFVLNAYDNNLKIKPENMTEKDLPTMKVDSKANFLAKLDKELPKKASKK